MVSVGCCVGLVGVLELLMFMAMRCARLERGVFEALTLVLLNWFGASPPGQDMLLSRLLA